MSASIAASKVCYGDARVHAGRAKCAIDFSIQVHWLAPNVLHILT